MIENKTFDEERAFYGTKDLTIKNCSFDGPRDGESAFKETKNIVVENSYFNLRYPSVSYTHLTLPTTPYV